MQRTQAVIPRKCPKVVVRGVEITGGLPCMVVFIRDTSKERRIFARFAHALNVGWEFLGDGAYLCAGGFSNLQALAGKWVVTGWHWTENKNVSKGSGAGEKHATPRSNKFDAPEDADAQNEKARKAEKALKARSETINRKGDENSEKLVKDALEK